MKMEKALTDGYLRDSLSLMPMGKPFLPEAGCIVSDQNGRQGTLLGYSEHWHQRSSLLRKAKASATREVLEKTQDLSP